MTITTAETSQQTMTLAGPEVPREAELFTPEALDFLGALHREFGLRVQALGGDTASRGAPCNWSLMVNQHLVAPPSSFISPRRLRRSQDKVMSSGAPISAGIVDFGLHIHRNAQRLLAQGRAPFVSVPDTGSEDELQIWQALFVRAEQLLGLPEGTIRAMHLGPGEPDMDDDEDGGASNAEILIARI